MSRQQPRQPGSSYGLWRKKKKSFTPPNWPMKSSKPSKIPATGIISAQTQALDMWICAVDLRLSSGPWETAQLVTHLPVKTWNPSIHIKSGMWWYMFLIPALEKWRQFDPWSSLTSQPSLIGKVRDPCLKQQGRSLQGRLTPKVELKSPRFCNHIHGVGFTIVVTIHLRNKLTGKEDFF